MEKSLKKYGFHKMNITEFLMHPPNILIMGGSIME